MKIMVSACLLGENCKYSGGNNYNEAVAAYLKGHEVIPVCPEVMGGLPTPRTASEICNGIVRMKTGEDVTQEFQEGAGKCLALAMEYQIDEAILQSRSPSCGVKQIYDGTFTGRKIDGHGVFAGMLLDHGFRVIDLEDLEMEKRN